ncbi:MAG TPA: hypothetical protein VHQ65_03300 [Thermoanaerobaculia bacterium]|nr:hypothetical protein [Thermoanaerobaculia bacterium]
MVPLVLLAAMSLAAEEEMFIYPDTPLSRSTSIRWTSEASPENPVLGIFYYQQDPGGSSTQLLIETPTGHRLALVERLDAPRGVMEALLQEDDSGWWVRLDQVLPAKGRFEEMRRQWSAAHDRAFAAGGTSRWSLFTAQGPLFTHEVPFLRDGMNTQAFLRALEENGTMRRLRAELPPAVVESLPFLLGALRTGSPLQPGFDEVIEILGRAAEAREGPPWTAEETFPSPKGFPESVPEYAALLERFEHVPLDPRN